MSIKRTAVSKWRGTQDIDSFVVKKSPHDETTLSVTRRPRNDQVDIMDISWTSDREIQVDSSDVGMLAVDSAGGGDHQLTIDNFLYKFSA